MHCHVPLGDRRCVVIVRQEAFCRTDLDTKVADAAPEAVDLPRLVLLGDNDGIGRTPAAAQSAKYAFIDRVFYLAPVAGTMPRRKLLGETRSEKAKRS